MVEELVKNCFINKLKSNDEYNHYSITPDEDDEGWYDAIVEARGRGIPISAFGDTRDKLVLHPGHLGYDFWYYWGNGSWNDVSCWGNDATNEDKSDALEDLQQIAIILEERGDFEVSYCKVSGSCKGYLSTTFTSFCPQGSHEDIVLFVYGLSPEYMQDFIDNDDIHEDE